MILKVENLSKRFYSYERGNTFSEVLKSMFVRRKKEIVAVDDISFSIDRGEIVGFLGPNGAGKSTTIKILTGVMYPTSGNANIMGYVPWNDRKRYVRKVGAVFGQKSQLIWDIPPIDAFYMNKAIFDVDDKSFKEILNEMVEMLGVEDVIKKPTRQLSLGERMKCEFIIAMIHNPEIVFLDEPTIGLDVFAKEKIREFILKMNKKGITFILTTHDLTDIERLASRVIVINHGKIVFNDDIDKLRHYSGSFKMISVKTENSLPVIYPQGVDVAEKISPNEVKLKLNTKVMPLGEFINTFGLSNNIKDMSIADVPIEEIIKLLYADITPR